jgi:hypothetical protein
MPAPEGVTETVAFARVDGLLPDLLLAYLPGKLPGGLRRGYLPTCPAP